MTPPETNVVPMPRPASSLADPLLYLLAESLNDLEKVRIASENRLRQLTRTETDSDGEERGFGLGDDIPAVKAQKAISEALAAAEHQATLALKRRLREHPLGAWVIGTRGVGEKQGARLIACIGDPYWNTLHNRPRTVSELWAYSGLHVLPAGHQENAAQTVLAGGEPTGDTGQSMLDTQTSRVGVAAKRRKGQKSNWNGAAKMRAYLVATSCLKARNKSCVTPEDETKHVEGCECSPYRITYDDRRKHTKVPHPDWTDGHSHNDGLRIASKALLKDLWIVARAVHQEAS